MMLRKVPYSSAFGQPHPPPKSRGGRTARARRYAERHCGRGNLLPAGVQKNSVFRLLNNPIDHACKAETSGGCLRATSGICGAARCSSSITANAAGADAGEPLPYGGGKIGEFPNVLAC